VSARGGALVSVVGAHFKASATLHAAFGAQRVKLTWVSLTLATCVAPALPPGNVSVTVSNNGVDASSSAAPLEVRAGNARLHSLTPRSGGEAGGFTVTVGGAGFTGRVLAVRFGDAVVDCTVVTSESAECGMARGAAGEVSVSSEDADGVMAFSFVGPVSIVSVLPSSGPTSGGTLLTVTGSGFTPTATPQCIIDAELSAPVSVQTSTLLLCASPAYSHGPATLSLGSNSVAISDAIPFSYYAPTVITAVQPSMGLSGEALSLKVVGDNFGDASAPSCSFSFAAPVSYSRNT
jgi:hypothetical protein